MSARKLALGAGLAAISLAGCGTTAKPEAGTVKAAAAEHKRIDDPRKTHVQCLHSKGIHVSEFGGTWLQVGARPYGPTIHFEPTPGAAQELQISGQVQSAEVIGSALLYPNQASDALLEMVEDCIAQGVAG
jgi:hypothetical protein